MPVEALSINALGHMIGIRNAVMSVDALVPIVAWPNGITRETWSPTPDRLRVLCRYPPVRSNAEMPIGATIRLERLR